MKGMTRAGRITLLAAAALLFTAGTITVTVVEVIPGYQLVRTSHTVTVSDDGRYRTTIVSAHEIVTVGGPNDGHREYVPDRTTTVASPDGVVQATTTTVPARVIHTAPPTTIVRTATATYDSPHRLETLVEASSFDSSVGSAHIPATEAHVEGAVGPALEAAVSDVAAMEEEAVRGALEVDRETLGANAKIVGDPVSVATGELVIGESDLVLRAGSISLDLRRTHRTRGATDGSLGRGWIFPLDSAIVFGEMPGIVEGYERALAAQEEIETVRRDLIDSLPALISGTTRPYQQRRAAALSAAANAHHLAAALARVRYTGELADEIMAEVDRQRRAALRIAQDLEAFARQMDAAIERVANETTVALTGALDRARTRIAAIVADISAEAHLSAEHALANNRFATGSPSALREVGTDALTVVGTDGVPRRFRIENGGYTAAEPTRSSLRRDPDGGFIFLEPDGVERRYGTWGELRSIRDRNGSGFTFDYDDAERLVLITDTRGRETQITRDGAGRIVSLVAPDGARTRYAYDEQGNLTAVTDPVGDRTTYQYDGGGFSHRIVAIGRPDGSARRYSYALIRGRWRAVETVDEEGSVERFDFSSSGRTGFTNPGGLTWTYHFDARNRTVRIDHPGGAHEELVHDSSDRVVRHMARGGERTEYEYDGRGNLTAVRYPDGTVEAQVWNADDLLVTRTDRRGFLTRYEYDARGNLTAITYPDGTQDRYGRVAAGPAAGAPATYTDRLGNVVSYTYDEMGFLAEAADREGVLVRRRNDALGRPLMVEDGAGSRTVYAYRDDGLVESATGPDGRTVRYEYSNRKDLVAVTENGRLTTIEYDARHLPVAVINTAGEETRHEWRPDGLLIAREVREADGRLAMRTEYAYDASGHRSAVSVPDVGSTVRFEYGDDGRLSASVGPTGIRTEYTTSFDGRITSAVVSAGSHRLEERYDYYPDGPLRSFTDASGARWSFSHDPVTRTVTETGPDGSGRSVVRLDPYGRPLERTDGTGRTTRFIYDARGRLTAVWNAMHREVAYTYDAADRLTSLTDGEGSTWRFSYDARGRVTTTTNPDGSTRDQWYSLDDTALVLTDETGVSTRFEYDAAGRLIARVTPDDAVTRWSWSALGTATEITDATGRTTRVMLDGAGRVVARADPAGEVSTYVYDAAGNLLAATDPTGRYTQYRYDELGRLTAVGSAGEAPARYAYDARGKVLAHYDGAGRAHRYEYDELGRLAREINRIGAVKAYRYDAADRVVSIMDFNGVEARSSYDGAGRLAQVVSSDGSFLRYVHDRAGRITGAENRDDLLRFEYDPLGRLTSFRSAATSTDLRYSYDAAGRMTGRRVAQNGNRTAYLYDDRGLLAGIDDSAAGYTRISHDAAGRRTGVRAPNGVSTTTRYDAAGRIAATVVTDGAGRLIDGVALVRDAAGRRVFDVDHEGAVTAYAYDEAGRLSRVSYPFDGPKREADLDAALALGLSVNAPGGARRLIDYLDAGSDEAAMIRDAYRTLGPLNKSDINPYQQIWTESFSYDAAGNRTAWSTDLGEVRYTYDEEGRLVTAGSVAYSYDMAGNLTQERGPRGVTKFDYTAGNRVESVRTNAASVTYAYDPLGRRISRTATASGAGAAGLRKPTADHEVRHSVFQYDGASFEVVSREERLFTGLLAVGIDELTKPLAHGGRYRSRAPGHQLHGLDAVESVRFTEVSLGGRALAVTGPEGSRYLSHDVLGSPRLTTGASGAITDRFVFDAYGSSLAGTLGPHQPYGYNGKLRDPVSGLYDYGFRDYVPLLGRFATPDPIRHGANWYAYVNADPVNFVDPLGLAPVSDLEAAGGTILPPQASALPASFVSSTPTGSSAANWESQLLEYGHVPSRDESRARALVAAQDRVMQDPWLAPGGGGPLRSAPNSRHTWCNQATCDVAEAVGIDSQYLTGGKDRYFSTANDIGERLALQASWVTSPDHRTVFEVTAPEAQALANRGNLVVASWINPTGNSGHVTTIRPTHGGFDTARGPLVANVGAGVGVTTVARAFAVGGGSNLPTSFAEIKYYHITNR